MNVFEWSAAELAQKIKAGELSAPEAVEAVTAAIDSKDGTYNCYTSLNKEAALQQAETVQSRIDAGEALSPLAGVPIGIKDNICTKGQLTTCASKILTGFKPPYNATVIEKLHAAGMIPLGKLNMDEFAMGSTTENSAFHVTRNPRNTACVPGGSSGGSCCSVYRNTSVSGSVCSVPTVVSSILSLSPFSRWVPTISSTTSRVSVCFSVIRHPVPARRPPADQSARCTAHPPPQTAWGTY